MNIALNIDRCQKSKPCLSPFCPFCRATMQANNVATCQRIFSAAPKSNLCFLTVLLPVTYSPQQSIHAAIQSCRRSVSNIFQHRMYKSIKLYGAFEIDVKMPSLVVNKPMSLSVLNALGFNRHNNSAAYLLHFHAIIDLSNHSKATFRKSLTRVFNKPYQVRLTKLRSDFTKSQSITNIANYMLKFRTQHSNNLFGNQATGKAKYGSFFGNALLQSYVKLIHSLLPTNRINALIIRKNC